MHCVTALAMLTALLMGTAAAPIYTGIRPGRWTVKATDSSGSGRPTPIDRASSPTAGGQPGLIVPASRTPAEDQRGGEPAPIQSAKSASTGTALDSPGVGQSTRNSKRPHSSKFK